jgi:YkoY family integral membrane protein
MMQPMISSQDILVVLFIIFLEGILSIDNALVLAILARNLPREQQRKALTYGLAGAVIFRLISLFLVSHLIRWTWVKFVGGAYLIFIAVKHFIDKRNDGKVEKKPVQGNFWRIVIAIELTDIAFAVDSILAAVALSSKFWVVFTGGVMGLIMMRFAATMFIQLLKHFPNLETTAYLLVLLIGIKVFLEGLRLPWLDFHSASSPAFWVFWGCMLTCVIFGFVKTKPKRAEPA